MGAPIPGSARCSSHFLSTGSWLAGRQEGVNQAVTAATMPRKQDGGKSKAGEAAQKRANSGQQVGSSGSHVAHANRRASSSRASSTDGDAALARQLQEQMDLENEQCEHVRIPLHAAPGVSSTVAALNFGPEPSHFFRYTRYICRGSRYRYNIQSVPKSSAAVC